MTVRAVVEDTVIAESDDTVVVEGNHYFPPEAVRWRHLSDSGGATVCPWKGIASYYTVTVDGVSHPDAAWTYRHPIPWVRRIKDRVAFWGAVEVEEV